jgi:toxin YoeB
MARRIDFSSQAFAEFSEWHREDKKVAQKIRELLTECARTPFEGKGKPEPLKGNYAGYWSRRITQEHRLIYRVNDERVEVASCYGHYE